jgi:hypothetical protein
MSLILKDMVIDKLQIRGKGATTFESEVAFTSTVYFLFLSWLWISLNTTSFFFVPATVIAYRRQNEQRSLHN